MTLTTIILAFATAAALFPTAAHARSLFPNEQLVVTTVPGHLRPYVVRSYSLEGIIIGDQTFYFPVTGPSSDNAFTLQVTVGGIQDSIRVFPHVHERHGEYFFCVRGRTQLWAQRDDGSEEQEGRLLCGGDYGAIPINTRHTLQFLDPHTELHVPIQPGGFEQLYYNLSQTNYTSLTQSPYLLSNSYPVTLPNATASQYAALGPNYDVYHRPNFEPRHDFENGTAPPGGTWHNGPNALAPDAGMPYWVAKDYGPKYLSDETGFYQVIQPVTTPIQSNGNSTFGTINIARKPQYSKLPVYNFPGHAAYEALDGLLTMIIGGQTFLITAM